MKMYDNKFLGDKNTRTKLIKHRSKTDLCYNQEYMRMDRAKIRNSVRGVEREGENGRGSSRVSFFMIIFGRARTETKQ